MIRNGPILLIIFMVPVVIVVSLSCRTNGVRQIVGLSQQESCMDEDSRDSKKDSKSSTSSMENCATKMEIWNKETLPNLENILNKKDLEMILCESTEYLLDVGAFTEERFVKDADRINSLYINIEIYDHPLLDHGIDCRIQLGNTETRVRTWDGEGMKLSMSNPVADVVAKPLYLYYYDKQLKREKVILVYKPYQYKYLIRDGDLWRQSAAGTAPYSDEYWLLLGRDGQDNKWEVKQMIKGKSPESICGMVNQ